MLPILYTEIGIGNRLLKSFLDCVDLRIERVPNDEIEARYVVYEAKTLGRNPEENMQMNENTTKKTFGCNKTKEEENT
jgi:type IV pilus biogenesis protein CpaD/CtpE